MADVAKITQESAKVLEVGGGLPGWVLRVVLAVAGAGAVASQADTGLEPVFLLLLALFAVLVAVVPASPAPAILIAAVAAISALAGPDWLRLSVLLAVPLLHLVHLSAALAAIVPVRSRVRLRALLRPARRFVAVQVVTLGVAGLLALLPAGRNGTLIEGIALVGTAGLVVLTLRLLPRARRRKFTD
jgi:hypothetical protein